jgi:hypothetical protein
MCLKNIVAGAAFPGSRDDFSSDEAWNHWKTVETSTLSQLVLAMVKFNPELGRSMPSADAYGAVAGPGGVRPSSVYSSHNRMAGSISNRKSMLGSPIAEPVGEDGAGDDGVPAGSQFTYIPPQPKKFYKRLLELCITADLEAMLSDAVDDEDEVSLGILTLAHLELLNECALRWRIGQSYRAVCFLDIVRQFYERNEVPLECIPEALQSIEKIKSEHEFTRWPSSDVRMWALLLPLHDHLTRLQADYLASVYSQLFGIFLGALYHAMDSIPNLKQGEVSPFLSVIEHVRDSGLLERFDVDMSARLADVETRVRELSTEKIMHKYEELTAQPDPNPATALLFLSDEIENTAKKLDKRFPEPLLGYIMCHALTDAELTSH